MSESRCQYKMELENIAKMEYPGRLIIIGRDISGEKDIVAYAITGRSPSSQARKLDYDSIISKIIVKPTNEEELKKGNIDLLIYPAIYCQGGIAVSNGKQTENIKAWFEKNADPVDVLRNSLSKWDYEPDAPNYTPRISSCITYEKGAALSIIKRAEDGSSMKNYFKIPLIPGKGKLIATYTGENKNPLPSFAGEPLDVELKGNTTEAITEGIYNALGPKANQNDFRVSVATVFYNKGSVMSAWIKNNLEKK